MALLVAMLAVIGYHVYRQIYWRSRWQQTVVQFGPSIVRFEERVSADTTLEDANTPWIPAAIELFHFDPNTLDSIGWVKLGFSPKQALTIINYRAKSGGFRKAEDLKKLYVVSQDKYEQLQPFIRLAALAPSNGNQPVSEHGPNESWKKPERETLMLEINSADSAQLTKLFGIGPSFAKRIVKYRQLLGGFRSVEQVLEVYGMDSIRYSRIVQNLIVDTMAVTLININLADEKQLMRHPYISPNQARAIVSYRQQHGPFKQVQQLNNIQIITRSDFARLRPYLTTH